MRCLGKITLLAEIRNAFTILIWKHGGGGGHLEDLVEDVNLI